MALVKCKECGKEISDQATSCPNCGCPIAKNKNDNTIIKILFLIIGIILLCWGISNAINSGKKLKEAENTNNKINNERLIPPEELKIK